MADSLPHWIRLRHELRTGNWQGLKVLWQRGIGTSWIELACGLFEDILESGGVWHLWGHSWEIEKYNFWDSLKKVLQAVEQRQHLRYIINTQEISGFW